MPNRTPEDRLRQLQRSLGGHDDQLRPALEAVGLGTWQWTPASGELICSPRARALQGLAADTPVNFDAFMSCVHPADRDALIGAMGDALRGGSDFSCEYRAVDRNGTQRRLRSLGRFIHAGARGSTLLITGVLQEIGAGSAPEHFDTMADGGESTAVARLDRELRVVSASPRFVAALGQDARPLAGRRLSEILPGLPPQWREAAARCLDGSAFQATVETFAPWDRAGERLGGSFHVWFDERSNPEGVLLVLDTGSGADDNAAAADAALPAYRKPWSLTLQLRSVADSATFSIVGLDDTGAIRYANAAWEELAGLDAERALHTDWLNTVHVADRAQVAADLSAATCPAGRLHFRQACANGDTRWLDCRMLSLRDEFGSPIGRLILAADATSRVQEFGSAAQRQDRLRMFARHLERMQELERIELADSLQQDVREQLAHFTTTLLTLSYDPLLACTAQETLQRLAQQAQQLHDRVRDLVLDLAPLGIEELDLAAALHRYIDEQRECPGLQFSLQLPEAFERVSRKVQIALYSVVREAVGNAVEHAQASRIEVSVELRGGHIRARISDDGIGIGDGERTRPGRFGLFAAGETLSQLDGSLRVFGVPGSGTVVEASVPLTS